MNLLIGSRFWDVVRATLVAAALVVAGCLAGCAQPAAEPAAQPEMVAQQGAPVEGGGAEDEAPSPAAGAVATPSSAGALQVVGARLCDQAGNPVQLRGVPTHGLAWYPGYVNPDFFTELRRDWNANVVHLAMYTAENGGWCEGGNRDELYSLVRDGVSFATEADPYAIVDWHVLSDANPLAHADEAAEFFGRISADLSANNNVIYEICNEPNNGTTWEDVKAYAARIIPIIRANDPDAVIIVGTSTWCQDVDQAAAAPLDAGNVMYALHFYAATHQADLRDRMAAAVRAGLPVFVSEFGICDASGNGSIDRASADAWVATMNELGISYACWNLSNKDEASALFKSTCGKTSGFTADDLSEEGTWLWDVLHSKGESGASAMSAAAGTESTTAGSAASANDSSAAAAGGALHGSTGTFDWTATAAGRWETGGQTFFRYVITVTNKGDSAVTSWNVRLPLSGTVTISDSWNAIVSIDGAELTLDSVSYNGMLAPQATAQDIGFILSGNALPRSGPITG